jgi:hypothetical protein
MGLSVGKLIGFAIHGEPSIALRKKFSPETLMKECRKL